MTAIEPSLRGERGGARPLVQVNLQDHFGGGEVYAGFFTRALEQAGFACTLVASTRARFWPGLLPPSCRIVTASDEAALPEVLEGLDGPLVTHGGLAAANARRIAARRPLAGIAHMPLYGRKPDSLMHHHLTAPVSAYVRDSLYAFLRPDQVYPEPLYGVAEARGRPGAGQPLARHSEYDWDPRKGRDRLLSWLHPLWRTMQPRQLFARGEGVTLGIVSRLTPIKQFPLLFSLLAPILARHPRFRLEVFGAGGYASVRDLRRALGPLGERARFWGHQADVAAVYGQLDFLMTGLPEKEALGLNVIEAQSCDLPVLAVNAPPFTETVLSGRTGYLYADPRQDGGADFERLLGALEAAPRLHPVAADEHLARFGFDAFARRAAAFARGVEALG